LEWALTYLFYAAIGICVELLMHRATDVEGDSAKLARIGEYATNVRLAILLTLLEGFSALVLAVVKSDPFQKNMKVDETPAPKQAAAAPKQTASR